MENQSILINSLLSVITQNAPIIEQDGGVTIYDISSIDDNAGITSALLLFGIARECSRGLALIDVHVRAVRADATFASCMSLVTSDNNFKEQQKC